MIIIAAELLKYILVAEIKLLLSKESTVLAHKPWKSDANKSVSLWMIYNAILALVETVSFKLLKSDWMIF